MAKCTGRGLAVKRPGVLNKVQMLNLVSGVGVFSLLPKKDPTRRPRPQNGPENKGKLGRNARKPSTGGLWEGKNAGNQWETKHWWFVGGVKMQGNEALVALGRSKCLETKHWRHIASFQVYIVPPPLPCPNTPALEGVSSVLNYK